MACTDQAGFNNVVSLHSVRTMGFTMYLSQVSMWEQANYPNQYPGTGPGNCTVAHASEQAWYALYDALGRAPTQTEVESFAGHLYDGTGDFGALCAAWREHPECKARFGCS